MKKVKALLLSAAAMTVSSVILLSLVSLILARSGSLSKGAIPLVTTVIGCAAVFLGSWLASLWSREKGILLGLISGALFSACVMLVSLLLLYKEFGIGSAGKLIAVFLSGAIGGILGVNRKSKVKF